MKRMIQYYSIYSSDKATFSTCSTKYVILGLYPDTAGSQDLLDYAQAKGIPLDGIPFVPENKGWGRPDVLITDAVKLIEKVEKSNGHAFRPELEYHDVYLGFVDLSRFENGTLKPCELVNNEGVKLTKDQVYSIINNQEYGVSDVGETVDKGTVLVKQGWEYYHHMPLLGYDLKSFEELAGITEHGFDDDTCRCDECGLYDNRDNGYTYNHRVVDECTNLGIRCGCFAEYNKSNGLTEYADDSKNAMDLETAEHFESKGKLKFVERFIGGMVDGRGGYYAGESVREGDPKNVLKDLKARYPERSFLFTHDESGQFQTYFSVWKIASKGKRFKKAKG